MASLLLFMLLFSAIIDRSSGISRWCICKGGLSDGVLQRTLDYACGAGADCNPTRQNGPCFSPNSVRAHCSYAVNSYFQRNRQAPLSCDFSGTASVVTSDPSTSACMYSSSSSGSSGGSIPVSATPMAPITGSPPALGTPGVLRGGGGGSNLNGLGRPTPNPTGINNSDANGESVQAQRLTTITITMIITNISWLLLLLLLLLPNQS